MCSNPNSQKFPQRRIWNGSNVHVIDDGPLSTISICMTTESVSHPFSQLYTEIYAQVSVIKSDDKSKWILTQFN